MGGLHKLRTLLIALIVVSSFGAFTAYAQQLPSSVSGNDGEASKINQILKELSLASNGQAGKLVPVFLKELKNADQATLLQVHQKFQPLLTDPSFLDALVQSLNTTDAEMASALLATGVIGSATRLGQSSIAGRALPNTIIFNIAQDKTILAALNTDNANVRKNIAFVLIKVSLPGTEAAQEALIKLLSTDKQAEVRVCAAIALGMIGSDVYSKTTEPIALAFGKAMIEDSSPNVREMAADGLSHMGFNARAAAPVLSRALKDKSLAVRFSVIETILNIGPGPACADCVDELIDLYEKPSQLNSNHRARILEALAGIGPLAASKTLPLLVPLLKDHATCIRAALLLHKLGESAAPAVPELITLLQSPYAVDRESAAIALGKIGPKAKAAIPALREAAGNLSNAGGPPRHNERLYLQAIDKINKVSGDEKMDGS